MSPAAYLYQQYFQQLNQQYMQGCGTGQQGGMMEMMGNVPAAGQLYDQAAGMIENVTVQAAQYNIPVTPDVWFALATCHFHAARTQVMQGWPQPAAMHLGQALDALNKALAQAPNFAPLHAAAGTVLAAQGNIPWAVQAFGRALQLNPADVYSQYMLGTLNMAQGNMAAGNQYYQAATQAAPNLPPPQQVLPPTVPPGGPPAGQPGGGSKTDWLGIMKGVTDLLTAINGTGNMVHSFMGGTQAAAQPSFGFGGQDFGMSNPYNFNPYGFS